jgi:hypothetical protein
VCIIADINLSTRATLDLKILRTQVPLKEAIFLIRRQTRGNSAVGRSKDLFYTPSFSFPILLISLNYTERIDLEALFTKFSSHSNYILKYLW